MMTETAQHELELPGCTPEPLMAYLKALGILRLVGEQKDVTARGWWRRDVFWLRSSVLLGATSTDEERRDALVHFFLKEYRPTPLVAPWNAGSGFYRKWDEKKETFKDREATEALAKIESSTSSRLEPYREQIRAAKNALKRWAKPIDPDKLIVEVRARGPNEGWDKRTTDTEVKRLLDDQMFFAADGAIWAIQKSDKDAFLLSIRSELLGDSALRWLDAAFVIRIGQKKNRTEAPMLGSGGNIGNSDFSARFMQILTACIPLQTSDQLGNEQTGLLRNALFGEPVPGLAKLAVDQFDPGRAGGANMHQGMEAQFRLNPWDYVLMLEGAVVLQSATSKRFGADSSGSVFPFTVESTPAGFISSGPDATRGEQWLPLWHRASRLAEVEALLGEGRSELGRRRARSGVEFARAAASLGVDRGIHQFVRIQYQRRFGDNYLATALGRVDTGRRDSIDLLRQIDRWLDRFRSACMDKDTPPRLGRVLSRIDSAVFDFCRYGGSPFFQQVLVTLGRAEREVASAERLREDKKLLPIAGLSEEWRDAASDDSLEFAVALGLAFVHDSEAKVGPLRCNLEAVDWKGRCRTWAEKDRSVVWNAADLPMNLANVLQRRLMDAERAGCERLPLRSHFDAPLGAVAAFLEGELDDERLEDLIWGLMLVGPRPELDGTARHRAADVRGSPPLPREYALLKLLFLPSPLVPERWGDGVRWRLARSREQGITIRPEPRILPLLRSGRAGEACGIAAQRLRASGLAPMPGPHASGPMRDGEWSELSSDHRRAQRLAAALLIPISSASLNRLVHLVCRDQPEAAEVLAVPTKGGTE